MKFFEARGRETNRSRPEFFRQNFFIVNKWEQTGTEGEQGRIGFFRTRISLKGFLSRTSVHQCEQSLKRAPRNTACSESVGPRFSWPEQPAFCRFACTQCFRF